MRQPTHFWRFNYCSDFELDQMVEQGTLILPTVGLRSSKYDPEDCRNRRMRAGDGILLARFDEDVGRGQIAAIGILLDDRPVTRVDWRRYRRQVSPNPQGGVPPWRERCFCFEGARADAYNFAADFLSEFPDP